MTRKEVFDNVFNGFLPSDKKGYSVKKMLAALIVLVMLVISVIAASFDKTFVVPLLGVWIPFVTALLITSAVEKRNALKYDPNEKSSDLPSN